MLNRSWHQGLVENLLAYLSGKKPHEIFYPSGQEERFIHPGKEQIHELINFAAPVGEITPFYKHLSNFLKSSLMSGEDILLGSKLPHELLEWLKSGYEISHKGYHKLHEKEDQHKRNEQVNEKEFEEFRHPKEEDIRKPINLSRSPNRKFKGVLR